jgi:hypothetical protein
VTKKPFLAQPCNVPLSVSLRKGNERRSLSRVVTSRRKASNQQEWKRRWRSCGRWRRRSMRGRATQTGTAALLEASSMTVEGGLQLTRPTWIQCVLALD